MRVRVRIDPNCRFDIGERTPESRSLVAQYVKGFIDFVAEHLGRPPGALALGGQPPMYFWSDANWRIEYVVERTRRRVTVTILGVERVSGGDRA